MVRATTQPMIGRARLLATFAAATLLAATAACSSPSGKVLQVGGVARTGADSAAQSEEGPAASPNLIIHYAAADGTRVTVSFALNSAVKSDDGSLSSLFPNGQPCPADPERDGVFAGQLSISNDTSGFTAALQVAMQSSTLNSIGDATLQFGADFGNGPVCSDLNGQNGYGAMRPALSPDLSSGTWGPVNVEFVVHGFYTPTSPDGDPDVLASNLPVLVAYEGPPTNQKQYRVAGVQGYIRKGVQGNVRLDLDQL